MAKNRKTLSCRSQFIDIAKIMASSLSNLVNNLIKNLAERVSKIKCKYGHDDKKCEACQIKYNDCECFF